MRSGNQALIAQSEGDPAIRTLMLFEFGEGRFGFWDGEGEQDYDGDTYYGPSLLQSPKFTFSQGTQSNQLELVVPANDKTGITAENLTTIQSMNWKNRWVTVMNVFFLPNTNTIIQALTQAKAKMDKMPLKVTANGSMIHIEARTQAFRNHIDDARFSSHSDQLLIDPNDNSHRYAATAFNEKQLFGRKS